LVSQFISDTNFYKKYAVVHVDCGWQFANSLS